MPSQSELSFGARLLRANNLLTYMNNFNGYAPPRENEAVANFEQLLENIADANAKESFAKQNYDMAVSNRHKAFKVDKRSVFKLLAPIRGAVQAQYGKDGKEFKLIDAAVKNIRASKVVKKTVKDSDVEVSVSTSEQSYGSITQYFTDLVNKLAQLEGYNPSNDAIKKNQLLDFVKELNLLNKEVASSFHSLRSIKNLRRNLYNELSERVGRIKAYVKGNYGTQSEEYTLIKGMKI
jgi:valyl-tRNA synthetase